MTPAGPDELQCGTHPGILAVDTCLRCGAFVCDGCLELLGEDPFCQACYQRPDVTGRPSARATWALVLAAGGLVCGAPLGIAGLLLAWREQKSIDRGVAPLSSRSYVLTARVLGWVSVGLTVLCLVVLSALMLRALTKMPH